MAFIKAMKTSNGRGNEVKGTGKGKGDSKGKKNPNIIPESFIREQKLCMRYQNDSCEHTEAYTVGTTTLSHSCSLCLLKKRGIHDHSTKKALPKGGCVQQPSHLPIK